MRQISDPILWLPLLRIIESVVRRVTLSTGDTTLFRFLFGPKFFISRFTAPEMLSLLIIIFNTLVAAIAFYNFYYKRRKLPPGLNSMTMKRHNRSPSRTRSDVGLPTLSFRSFDTDGTGIVFLFILRGLQQVLKSRENTYSKILHTKAFGYELLI